MIDLLQLAEQIRHESEREPSHESSLASDTLGRDVSLLLQSGERDFQRISQGIEHGEQYTAVEIGCRSGRMLKSASRSFGRVVGFDISERSINRARALVGTDPRIELAVSSALDLSPLTDGCADFVWSFSSLSMMPPLAVASYLREARRVLRENGSARFQIFFGDELRCEGGDLIHPRAYHKASFEQAAGIAGFQIADAQDMLEGLGGPLADHGVETLVVTLKPAGTAGELEDIARALTERLPRRFSDMSALPDLEALAAIDYATGLAERGDRERAAHVLRYVEMCCRNVAIDVRDILDRVVAKTSQPVNVAIRGTSPAFEANLAVIRERFPAVSKVLEALPESKHHSIHVTQTTQGIALWREGACFDHSEKPQQAASTWVSRALQDRRMAEAATLLVVGFGGGYHIDELLKVPGKQIWCYEPCPEALRATLSVRDMTSALKSLSGLSCDVPDMSAMQGSVELLIRPQNQVYDADKVEPLKTQLASRRGLSALHPRIAVLGPLQGGTIPTGYYTQAALQRFGQRSRGIDMSGFNKGYELLDDLVRGDAGRAVARSSYVEMLTSAMLQNFDEKPIDVLICMAQAPASAAFLTEMRKRGVVTALWFVEDYLRFTYWKDIAKYYDFVFTIQKGACLEAIRKAGAGAVHYVPTACDPTIHRPLALSESDRKAWGSEISFVGAGYHNRQQMFASLSHYPFKIWGSEWPTCRPFDTLVQQNARRISPEEYIKIFNATEINLNLHSSTERDGVEPHGDFVNPRTFELAASGAFQLVDERSLLPECFEIGSEIVTFKDLRDLTEKIAFYRAHPEERMAVAARAQARALRDHTYDKRVEQMLSIIFGAKYQHLRAREEASPWTKLIERSAEHPELKERCERARERGEQPNLDALVSDVVTGNGKLSETEQKLMFLFHVKKHILRPALKLQGDS